MKFLMSNNQEFINKKGKELALAVYLLMDLTTDLTISRVLLHMPTSIIKVFIVEA